MLTQIKPGSKQMPSFRWRLSAHGPVLAAVGSYFLLLTVISWQRWVSPIADSGRELDLPRRLLEGEMLYRDVHYLYGPLAPYLKALLYSLFGARLAVLQGSGLLASLVIVVTIYAIARQLLGKWEAGLAVAAVILLCVFKPGGNLISPYSYAALYALVFSLGAVQATIAHTRSGRTGDLLLAGLLTGLAAVTKLELALAAALAAVVGLISVWERGARVEGRRIGSLSGKLLLLALPVVLIALPVYGFFFRAVGWRTMIEDCHIFYTHLPDPMIFYNAHRSGLDRPFSSLLQLAGGGMVLGLLCLLFLILANPDILRRRWLATLTGLTGMIGGIVAIRMIVGAQWDGSPLRFMPVLLGLVIVNAWRSSPTRLVLAVYSLAVLARVALRVPSGGAFGSFFLPGSLVILIWWLLHWLPEWAKRAGMIAGQDRLRRVIVITVMAVLTATTVIYAVRYRRTYRDRVETPYGTFYAPVATGQVIRQAIQFIAANTKPNDPVAVLPEGSDLTFLAGRAHPLRHQILVPGLMSPADELEAIRTLEKHRVEYILIVNRPMREFGLNSFGEDYYLQLGGWISDHYRPLTVYGADGDPAARIGDPRFFIRILVRQNPSAP